MIKFIIIGIVIAAGYVIGMVRYLNKKEKD